MLNAQISVTNRPATDAKLPPAAPGTFWADEFQVGTTAETWVVDHIRVRVELPHSETVALFGGLEPDPTQAECDCHNLVKVQQREASSGDLDFSGLAWSVPGGSPVVFGVSAPGIRVLAASDTGRLLKFSDKGKFLDWAPDEPRMNIQVWAHVLVPVSITSGRDDYKVSIHVADADGASLRLGKAAPLRFELGNGDVVAWFSRRSADIPEAAVNACVSGKTRSGVPFGGCDLLKKP